MYCFNQYLPQYIAFFLTVQVKSFRVLKNLVSIHLFREEGSPMLSQKILVVDDEKLLSEMMLEALQIQGFDHVESAANGQEGYEKYKILNPDLVIMDIEMPVMDGYDSSSKIKSFDPEARILVLTGDPGDSRAKRIMNEGIALSLYQKPISLIELARIVRENLPH